MGLFDDFTQFVSELGAIRNDVSQLKEEVVTNISDTGQNIQQTISDTAAEANGTLSEIQDTISQTTDLSDDNR